MAKLKELEALYASLLGLSEASIHVLAMMLRKERLIRSTGRGLHAADMGPSDATNLLLAAVGGGMPTKAAETVRMLRTAVVVHATTTLLPDEEFGPADTANEKLLRFLPAELSPLAGDREIGAALDSLFREQASGAPNRINSFQIIRTGKLTTLTLLLADGPDTWNLRFLAPDFGEGSDLVLNLTTVLGPFFEAVSKTIVDFGSA